MLQFTVTNERQRRNFTHDSGPMHFGRNAEGQEKYFAINDQYVSRDQLKIEELPGGEITVENRGRNAVVLIDQTEVPQGQFRKQKLPTRLVVGETVIEVALKTAKSAGEATFVITDPDAFSSLSLSVLADAYKSYPYPIAYGSRPLAGITNPAEHYADRLRYAENLIAFIASVSLALLDDEQIGRLNQALGRSALSCWQGGISPGNWLDLAIHVSAQFPNDEANPLAKGLASLQLNKGEKGIGKVVRELIKAKNDFKHDRGPTVEMEYRAACNPVNSYLQELLEGLSFLNSHPLRLVLESNPHRRGDKADVVSLKCIGDHPGFVRESSLESQSLRKGDLYIDIAPSRKISLYPFIHATTCRQCKAREFFFIDRIDRGGGDAPVAQLKSFERGHTEQDDDIGRELHAILDTH